MIAARSPGWVIQVQGIRGKAGYLRIHQCLETGIAYPQIRGLEDATQVTGTEAEVRAWCSAAQALLALRHPDARLTPEPDPR